jgi:serine/threonine protein kinase
MQDLIGQVIGGYEVVELIGTGGTSTVYKAVQTNIRREVAFKVMKVEADNVLFVNRFRREIQTVASLSHPHILKMFDYGQHDDLLYLVTELITGGSLAGLIVKGAMPLNTIDRILGQLTSALDYIHRKDIVHRDLKPHNVLLDNDENVVLADMGLVKLMHEDAQITRLTIEGQIMGSPPYMAPEQWTQEAITPRTDIYALGVILFEMLTGKLPFHANTSHQLMQQHIYEVPPSLNSVNPNVPVGLQLVLDKALAKDPGVRYETAQALLEAYRAKTVEKPKIQVAARLKLSAEGTLIAEPQPESILTISGQERATAIKDAPIIPKPPAAPVAPAKPSAGRNLLALLVLGVIWAGAIAYLISVVPSLLAAPQITSTHLVMGGIALICFALALILPLVMLRRFGKPKTV